jgi:uncharacterized repeat protein (TIGR01451 family)
MYASHSSTQPHGEPRHRFSWLQALLALVLVLGMLAADTPPNVYALNAGDLTFTLVTPVLPQDSNDSCAAGPKAIYIEVLVTNPVGGVGTLTNLTANISAFAGAAGVTLDAGESTTRYIGPLTDGASFPMYFFVNYPCQAGSNPPPISSTFTATVSDGLTAPLTSGTLTLTTRSELSSLAGARVLNSTIGPGAVLGQIIPMTVQYDFGNPGGAQLAMIQPAGNISFDGGCFRLMSVDITAVTGFTAGLTTAADDQLYFTGVNGASSNTATVVYYFKMLCSGVSTTANPFSDLTSGGQLKYTGNFGTCSAAGAVCPAYPPPTNPFTINKSVSPANLPTGGTATYTVVINNPSVYASKIDEIIDVLPAGVTFAAIGGASQVTAANSSRVPTAGDNGTLTFQGIPTTSCVGGTCDGSYDIPANGSLTLIYTVNVPNTAGSYTNSAAAVIGSTTIGPATATMTVGTPALSLTKSDGNISTTPGSTIPYVLAYTNSGNVPLTGVTLNETVPANTTFNAAASTAGWSCANGSPAGTVCTFTIGSLAVGASGSVNFAVTVVSGVPAGTTQISNAATVTANGGTSAAANDTTPVNTTPDLSLTKSDSGATTTPGGTVAYTLSYQNTGDVGLTGVVINETVPANTTFNAGASTPGWSCANGSTAGTSCTLTIGNLTASSGGAATFAVTVVNPLPAGVTQIANTATIADDGSNGPDATPGNNSSSATTPVNAAPDLSITKSDNGATTTPGSTVAYTLSYANTGNQNATGVLINETVPANTTFNAASSTLGWSCANGAPAGTSCTFSTGNLAAGASGSVTFAVTVDNPLAAGVTQVANTATIADDGSNGADPTPGDNSSGDTTPIVTAPGLILTKTDNGTSTVPGGTVAYTLNYANTGNIGLTGVQINETVPANTTFNAGTSTPGWSCANGAPAGTSCIFTVGTLVVGSGGTIIFAVTVNNPLAAGVIQVVNTATISDGTTSFTNGDTTPVNAAPDLSITKSDSGATTVPGGTVAYTLSYANTGNQNATGVQINETVPANTTFNAGASTPGWSCANGAPAGTSCIFTVGTLVVGSGGSVIFAVTVDNPLAAGITQVANTATINDDGSGGTDPTPSNNSSNDSTPTITSPGLTLTKTDGGISTIPGGAIIYTLSYANTGNVGLTGVVINETVPANTTFNAGGSTAGWSCANGSPAGTSCILTIGAFAGGANGTATFAVTVNNPLPAGVTQIANTAQITDGSTSASNSDTTPINAAPDLSVTKSDDGATTIPGGVVVYTLFYANTGNQNATGVLINETVPANTTFTAAGSTVGWSCANGAPAATPCTLTIGNLAAGASGSVNFAVTVDNPLPVGVTQVANTATINDDGTGGADPTPGDNSSGDTTPIVTAPGMSLTKTDGGISAVPGGTVAYTLGYANTGNVGLTGVVINETVPANTTFNTGGSTAGWSCTNGAPAGTACVLTIGNLAGGASGSVVFAITVVNPLPAGIIQIFNSATISDGRGNSFPNSDVTPVNAAPDLVLTKSDGGMLMTPGGLITYTLSYTNTGNQNATGVVINETVPANTTFTAAGSTAGWSCANGAPAATPCALTIGNLAAGANGTATFIARVVNPLPAGVLQLVNTAQITDGGANGGDPTPSNNAGTVGTPINPTAIMLVSFTATPIGGAIRVQWVTSAEFNTWGFYLYRGADGIRDHAVRITPELILGRGRGQGASYAWDDTTAEAGVTYSYWLQEIELNGHTNEYGPARAATGTAGAQYRVFLPLAGR